MWLCVCTQAWPTHQPLLPEARREVASLGASASNWRRKCRRKRPGNRGSIPSQGSWRDLWLHTQTSRAFWGAGGGGEGRAAGFPVEASITAAQAEAPAQAASSRWALGAAHLAGQAGGRRQTLPGQQASRQRPGLPPPQPSRSPNQLLIKGPEPSRPPETDCGLQ